MNGAKETFLKYSGSYFHMERDGNLTKYKSYNIDESTEKEWLREYKEEMITQIQIGNSIDVYLSRLCSVMRQTKDDGCLETLYDALNKNIKNVDSFVRLRIAEELQELISYFISNDIGDMNKLSYYKSLTIDVLRNVISQPIVISEETRKSVVFEDVLKEENIIVRAKQSLKNFE